VGPASTIIERGLKLHNLSTIAQTQKTKFLRFCVTVVCMMPMMRTRPLRELTSTWVRGAGARGDRGMPPNGVTAPAGQRPTSQLTSAVESGERRASPRPRRKVLTATEGREKREAPTAVRQPCGRRSSRP